MRRTTQVRKGRSHLDAYPRPLERDLELAEAAGADVVFTPTTSEMYPEPTLTNVHVDRLTSSMEGASRPTHFDAVTRRLKWIRRHRKDLPGSA